MLANSTSKRQVAGFAFSSLRIENIFILRFFMVCLLVASIGSVAGFGQTVTLDQSDYAPLSNATITGSGFGANETVVLKVKNISRACNTILGDSSYLPWSAIADQDGNFETYWAVCNCPGDSLKLKATGLTSGLYAEALFSDAQPLASWVPAGLSAYGPSPWSPTTLDGNITAGGLTRGTGMGTTGTAAGNAWGGAMTSGATTSSGALSANQYFSFSITAKLGYTISAETFDLFYRRSGTGPANGLLQYSIGAGSFSDIATFNFTSTSPSGSALPQLNLSSISSLQNVTAGTQINFRIILYNASSGGTFYVFSNGLAIGGTITSTNPSTPPSCATSPLLPGNTSTGIAITGTSLSWSPVTGATFYDVYFGTDAPVSVLVSSDQPGTAFSTGALNPATTYYWKVVPKNNAGSPTACSIWSFTTACPSYPSISVDNQLRCGDGNVTFTVNSPGTGYTIEWSNDGSTVDHSVTGNTNTKFVTVGTPVTVWVRFSYSTGCKSAWVSATGSAGTFSNISTLLLENFSTGTSLPGGWANSGPGTWDIENSASSNGYTGASGESNATADNNTVLNASLTSKSIDFTGATNGILTFGLRRSSTSFLRSLAIDVSTNNGGSFVTVQTITAAEMSAASWSVQTIDLGSLINNASQVKIRFRITGSAGSGGPNVRIDDIKLTGAVSSPASIFKVENCDGTVTLTSSEGAAYAWAPGGSTSRSISVNATGTYSVTVTGATYGCTSNASTTISVLPTPVVAIADIATPKCFGESGKVIITASGGDGVYTGSGTFTVAAGANYSYVVTDSKGCTSNVISGVMPAPAQVVASSIFDPILCIGGTTLVNVSAIGGTGSYTGTGAYSKPAGLYSFTVTDENGCASVTSGNITEPSEIIINEVITNVSCHGNTDGSVNLSISGGTPSAKLLVKENFDGLLSSGSSASWANNSTIANWYAAVNGTTPGTYQVSTGTNAAGAIYSFGVAGVNSVSDRALGSIASGGTNDILGAWKITNTTTQTLTSITVNYTGEQWRNGGNTTAQSLNFDYQVNASSITTGSWTSIPALNFTSLKNTSTATELDGNDPSNRSAKTATFSISLAPGQAIWLRWTDVNDAGNDHGLAIDDLSAELSAGSGNTAPYTYAWSTGATTQNLSGVGAGTYTVTVTDGNSCSKQKSVTVTQPDPIATSETVAVCDSYTWPLNGQLYTTTGTHTYVYQNANGCSVTNTLHLTINKSTTSEESVTACDSYVWHGVTYTVGGDYTYSSTNASGCPHVETLHLTINNRTSHSTTITVCESYTWSEPLGNGETYTVAGTYTHVSTNAEGCSHTETLILSINPPIVFSAIAHQPKCATDKGSVTLGTPTGGTGNIHFNGTATTNLAPGTYTYTATDELGCSSTVSVVIDPAPSALVASASAGTISCFGSTTILLVTATGGTLPYSGTGSFGVGAGPYAYTVTDGNGCISTASGTISQPNALSIVCSNSNPNLYYGYVNGQSTIIKGMPSGGTAPYTISITMDRKLVCDNINASGDEFWTASGGTSSNNICSAVNNAPVSTLSGVAEGGSYALEATLMNNATFTITVTDANGCVATCSTFVKAEDVRCFSGNSGNAKIAICHKTGNTKNPCTAICVDQSALAEHLAHGDYLGNCTSNCTAPAIVASAATTAEHYDADEHATKLELKVMNNPAFNGSAFKLKVLSNNQQEFIQLKVMDLNGRPVELKHGIRAGQTIEIGRSYIGGMYVVEATQAGQRVVVKLIRQ